MLSPILISILSAESIGDTDTGTFENKKASIR